MFTPMSEYLERGLDEAMMKITTGAKTYSQAIGDMIDEMTSSGVRWLIMRQEGQTALRWLPEEPL